MLRRARTMSARAACRGLDDSAEPWKVSGRFQWTLDPIRTCHRHGIALDEIAVINSPDLMNDIARIAASRWGVFHAWPTTRSRRLPPLWKAISSIGSMGRQARNGGPAVAPPRRPAR